MNKKEKFKNSPIVIRRILPKGDDKYDVYFSFADFPITMNKSLLNHIMKDIEMKNEDNCLIN